MIYRIDRNRLKHYRRVEQIFYKFMIKKSKNFFIKKRIYCYDLTIYNNIIIRMNNNFKRQNNNNVKKRYYSVLHIYKYYYERFKETEEFENICT